MSMETPRDAMIQKLQDTLSSYIALRPALKTVLKPFGKVLIEKATLVADLMPRLPAPDFNQAAARFLNGFPVMASINLAILEQPLRNAWSDLLPVLAAAFPSQKAQFSVMDSNFRQNRYDPATLAAAYLQGDDSAFHSVADRTDHSAGALGFVFNWVFSTVLHAARTAWQTPEAFVAWSKGCCPFCGSLPTISYLSRPQASDAPYPDSGGKRFLHCTLCGQQWRIERNRCPSCDTGGRDGLVYYQTSENPGERIDACQHCQRYLLCVDLRERTIPASMDMASLAMVHLDLAAREKGYRPMAWTPWNRME